MPRYRVEAVGFFRTPSEYFGCLEFQSAHTEFLATDNESAVRYLSAIIDWGVGGIELFILPTMEKVNIVRRLDGEKLTVHLAE